jgi:hypothetical protein
MKILLNLIGLLLLTNFSSAQEPKTVKQKKDTRNGKSIFYVVKDQPDIKQGRYVIKAWSGNTLLVEGQYVNNVKTGEWIERYYGKGYNGATKSKGSYENGIKVGTWHYYNFRDELVQTYDHTNNSLVFSDKRKDHTSEFPAEYVGGLNSLIYEINQQVSIPSELNTRGTNRLEISTDISIAINSDGQVDRVTFSRAIGYGIDEKIEEWIKSDANSWIAGSNPETPITIPLRYKMMF